MDVELYTDLIKDERGNYYVAVHKDNNKLTLVNALAERSYDELLAFNDQFKTKYADYEHQFIGKIAMDNLRHDIVFALKEDAPGRMYALDEIAAKFQITYIDMIEFYRNPRIGRDSNH
jgi:hypothetical protein